MHNLDDFRRFLSTCKRAVIVTHHRPDADALGSSLGLAGYLEKKGLKVNVLSPSDYPAFLNWLPGNSGVQIFDKSNVARIGLLIDEADIVFCLDFSALSRINDMGELVRQSKAKKVLIDHHPEPEHFADFEQWDDNEASTANMVYYLIRDMADKDLIDQNIASCLYAGLLTDTGGFRHANTRREEFLIAADLVEHGAEPAAISRMIYDTNTIERLRLTGFVLSEKLQVVREYCTAYLALSPEDLKRFSSQTGDTEGFVNYGLSVNGINFSVFIYQRRDEVKLSFRSLGKFSVNEFARKHFSGGGHQNAAGGQSTLSLEETVNKLLELLPEYEKEICGSIKR